ncbi:NEW3 domain-containing protein [Chitinophaga sp. GCM10012297]|uniref:Alpha-galactosidase NEW3 domain-containing protein n=1 Tax=Chitinophaga chungangae TaxID=2821488 RepID=A0ABS3YH13_9BACT|nr:NEW3 domain-containing protein [Chitinophaga chungangae]MBO9153971.1 hypothetical protein [Chitinophaga chungangae]
MSAITETLQRQIRLKPSFFLCFIVLFFCGPRGIAQAVKQAPPPPFSVRLMNIEAAANATFSYNAKLRNDAASSRVYQFSAQLPAGWTASFKVEGIQVTSLRVDAGVTQDVLIELHPAMAEKPGKYKVPVTALSNADSLKLDLEAVVKGAYKLELSTPTGRLSDDVTEGKRKEIHLVVKNAGTIALDKLELSAQTPPQWQASFVPSSIERLEPGKEKEVIATLSVPDKTIAGDYVTTFSAKNAESSSDAVFRMTVKTSALTGWLGVLIILLALGAVYYLIRKYGRR